jgi:adenylylsulfate kinase-like enzyme
MTIWLTGLTAAGKSTLVESVFRDLHRRGYRAELLDADCRRLSVPLPVVRQEGELGIA